MSAAKIDIIIEDERVFYTGDSIKGTIRFEALANMKIERINLQFLGFARTVCELFNDDLRETHDLVYKNKKLYPYVQVDEHATPNDDDDDDGLESLCAIDRGFVLEQKFEFKIPQHPCCSYNTSNNHKNDTPLPPTMSVKEGPNSAEVEYKLVVCVDSPMKFNERIVEEVQVRIGTSGTTLENPVKNPLSWKKRKQFQTAMHLLRTDMIPLQLNTKSHFRKKVKSKLPVHDMNFRIIMMKPDELMVGGPLKSRVFLICYTAPDVFKNEYIDKQGVTTMSSNGLGVMEIVKLHMFVKSNSKVKAGVDTKYINYKHDLLQSTDPITIDLADLCPISKCYLRDYRLEVHFPGSYAMDISEFFPPLRVPETIPRKFSTCNIELISHDFELILDISSRSKVWTKMRCRLYRRQEFS